LKAFFDLVRRVVESFGAVGLDYMFTGALAASYYGVPRTTMDVDVVVEVTEEEARSKLVSALKQAGLVVDGERIDAALRSGYGIILGLATFYQSPEDLILAKLRMIKATVPRERALKDEDDVRAILRFTEVDIGAVKEGARRSNTLPILEGIIGGSFRNDES